MFLIKFFLSFKLLEAGYKSYLNDACNYTRMANLGNIAMFALFILDSEKIAALRKSRTAAHAAFPVMDPIAPTPMPPSLNQQLTTNYP